MLRQRGTEAGRDPAERRQKHCIGLGGHQGEIEQPRQGWGGKQGTFSGIVSDSPFDKSPVAYSHQATAEFQLFSVYRVVIGKAGPAALSESLGVAGERAGAVQELCSNKGDRQCSEVQTVQSRSHRCKDSPAKQNQPFQALLLFPIPGKQSQPEMVS